MARPNFPTALLAALAALFGAVPALAQFGSIFGEPPRPPSAVPSGQPVRPRDQQVPREQQVTQPQPPAPASVPQYGAAPPSVIRSQPLPPPPGATAAPEQPPPQSAERSVPPGQPPLPGLPPGQRQPRGVPQPANTAPQLGDEVVTAAPSQKIANPAAVFSGLDKITGRIISFDVAVNETVQFGALRVTARVCYTRPPTETANTDGFVEVDELTLQGQVRRLFSGWMFAASPGLHAVEHPIYDVWLVDCKQTPRDVAAGNKPQAGTSASAAPSAAPPAPAPSTSRR